MKISHFFSRKISAKLVALFLAVSVIPVLVIGYLTYNTSKQHLRDAVGRALNELSVYKGHHVEKLLSLTQHALAGASAQSVYIDNLISLKKGINEKAALEEIDNALLIFQEKSNLFRRAKILDTVGKVIAATDNVKNERPGADCSDNDYFKKGLIKANIDEPAISDAGKGIQEIAYSEPIKDYAGNTLGVFVIHQALAGKDNSGEDKAEIGVGIEDITTKKSGSADTEETYLVNGQGKIFTYVDPKRASLGGNKMTVEKVILDNVFDSFAVLEPYKDYGGELCIGRAHKIEGTSWILIGEYDEHEAYNMIRILLKETIIITLLIIVLVTLLALIIARYFTSPINKLTRVAKSMTLGILNDQFTITQQDELGELGNSFRAMQKSLLVKADEASEIANGNLTVEIQLLSDQDSMGLSFKIMVENLRVQLNEISEGINVLAASSSEIMAAVTQLASSSAETATSVGETTTTVEEVKQTAEVANQKAKSVSENSVRTINISSEGTKAIANTIEGMNRIRQHMNAIAAMVVRLSDQSQTIGEITATVNELAEQSNLLAVNAAIEAAKAGEQGKGFTVVAQEIKMLADRSKEATAQVRNILRDIQKSISSAVMATEEGGKAVDEGLKLTNLSGDTIKALAESVNEAARAAIQIAASSQQQLEGMDQVVAAMENIKEASMQSAASTQQSADSVNELQKVGQRLDILMKQYKLVK